MRRPKAEYANSRTQPFGVLFLQSQSFLGADSTLHAQLMRHLDRTAVDVHVALTTDAPRSASVSAARAIRAIPNIHIRPTDFGPSIHGSDRVARLWAGIGGLRVGPSLLGLAAYIRSHNIQIIHCTEKPRDALYGVLLGRLTGARSVIHMHVAYGEWMSRSTRWALAHADSIIAISHFVAASLEQAGYSRERIHVVPNALDLDAWDPAIDGRLTRRELGLPLDAKVIGIISRLFRWKGHAYLIDAMAVVKRLVPEARLVIVGEDDPRAARESKGPFSAQLQQQAESLGIGDAVLFTGFRTDIAQLIAAFDIFAHPSWEEPFGMVFLEAMAMRRPVVAWDSGGAPEVIVHGQTGLLAERGSVAALADAMLELLGDPVLRRRFGDAGRQRVERDFSADGMAQAILEAYKATLTNAISPTHPATADIDRDRAA